MGKDGSFHFQKIGNTRIVPLYFKIIGIFVFFLLISNFSSNLINLFMNRGEQIQLMRALLVKDLQEVNSFATNQLDLYNFEKDLPASLNALKTSAEVLLKNPHAVVLGLKADGSLLYAASKDFALDRFTDTAILQKLNQELAAGTGEGDLNFTLNGKPFFGHYKYHAGWQAYLIRAEDEEVFYGESWKIFWNIAGIIVLMSAGSALIGSFVLRIILRFVGKITQSIMDMQRGQELKMIDMKGAPNDDVTYLGLSFNSLSSTIGNLLGIFRKFVTQDVARKAYQERRIRLEGKRLDLTILFTDIKGFTYMTETLGNDIIKLLNLHYDKAIRHIQDQDGIVGSIIGDALLAVFGSLDDAADHKSLKAIKAAYLIQDVAAKLRDMMRRQHDRILAERGSLTPEEERVYKAVLLEVGVGIDGGEVFYGNIGSYVRMTNTVIGDNVNSASRLEGLTRVYRVPIIVSEYVKTEVEAESDLYYFQPLDLVQVKGKTEGKKVFWPIEAASITPEFKDQLDIFTLALGLYIKGSWKEARSIMANCNLPIAAVFKERMEGQEPPAYWNGIWTMTSK